MNLLRRIWHLPENLPRLVLPTEFGRVDSSDRWGVHIVRAGKIEASVHHGPNIWYTLVIHPDGSMEPLAVGENLLTNAGRDLLAAGYGNPTGKDGALTASSATSATPAGGGLTTDQYKGWRVFCPVTGLTTAPVYGNIGSNSTTVLTVDGWWVGTSDTMTGTTPAATNGYHIQPCNEFRFMAVTADTGAPAAGDTTLAAEQTANGLGRAKTVYAHTGGTGTYTAQFSYSVTGGPVTVHKGALLSAANATAAGVMGFEANLNNDAIVNNLDTLQVTATVTLS